MDHLPFLDAGMIVILFTIIVKVLLYPFSLKATKAQMEMKSIEADLKHIKEAYKDNKELQAQKTIELYKEKNINPFAGFFILLIQLPIVISLYRIFLKSGLPSIHTDILYSFIAIPAFINMNFLGFINISEKNIILAVLAGISTYLQMKYATPNQSGQSSEPQKGSTEEVLSNIQKQMKYTFPVLVVFISWSVSVAVSLYWITSNVFAVFQELYIRRKLKRT
jgi:YidC/Oxa1 family membrane protein insertase